jgi:UDP-galactopyranose mutase
MYDYLVVGAGLFGAVFAREATDRGLRVLVVDKRHHIGGNCYTEERGGIPIHVFGPHVFHTADKGVWDYVRRFADFNGFSLRVKARHGDRLFPFPINLSTLHMLWGVTAPAEAEAMLASVRVPCEHPRNLEEWALAQVGPEIYEKFIVGYTTKQWGRPPSELPASIIRRLPIRLTHTDRHFPDKDAYEGVPIGGYTPMFERMLDGIEVRLGVDYHSDACVRAMAQKTVYTGPIDTYFGHRFGPLEYRSLRFEHEEMAGDFQGTAVVNYTEASVPWTRIVEHKHFALLDTARTVITREYPQRYEPGGEPFYPVSDARNQALYSMYRFEAQKSGVLFGGRLGRYQYMDMHQVVANARHAVNQEIGG